MMQETCVNETVVMADGAPTAIMYADTCPNIHEDDILNTEAFPLRPEDLEELEAVEDWVEMLASMDELEENETEWRSRAADKLRVMTKRRSRSLSESSMEIENAKSLRGIQRYLPRIKSDQRAYAKYAMRKDRLRAEPLAKAFSRRTTISRLHPPRTQPRKFN